MNRLRLALALIASLLLASLGPTAHGASADGSWSSLEDPSGSLSLEQLRATAQRFQPADPQTVGGGGDGALWLYQRLPANQEQLLLRVIAPYLAYLDLYVLQGDQLLSEIHTGTARPGSKPLPSRDFLLPLPRASEPLDLYLRLASPNPQRPAISLQPASLEAADDGRPLLLGGLIGALGMLVLYNLVRFSYNRTRSALWLLACQACLLVCALLMFGIIPETLLASPGLQHRLATLAALLATLCGLGFVHAFIASARPGAKLLTPLRALAAITLLGALLLPLLDARQASLLGLGILTPTLLLLLIGCLQLWRDGHRPARLLCLSWLLACLGLANTLSTFFGLWPLPGELQAPVFLSLALLAATLASMALTEQLQLQLLANISASRQRAAKRAQVQTKAEFLAKISHEIRTPMNGVLGMTELLLGTSLSAKQRDYVQTIHSAGNELLTLINEILDISRLESGQIELDDVQFDLQALLEDCLDIFRAKAEQQRIELISFVQPQVPQVISGDPTRLRQILLSLLDCAFKQTDAGEILLVTALEQTDGQPRLRFAVQDSGQPLSTAEREELLQAELHSKDFLAASTLGGRLALLIARQLVRLMGGEFGIQSGEQQGNTLWLSLPLDPQRLQQADSDLHGPLQGARLLVVDDNETCRKVLQQQCSGWGLQVSSAGSGREALALLRTKAHLHEFFDVVLLDQNMPGMTGMQLAAKIKEDPGLNHDILLVMLTGISDAPSKVLARNAGIKHILAKPVAGYTLRTTLAAELGQRNQQRFPTAPGAAVEPSIPADFRVLVAEDNSISTKVIRGMLNKLGVQPDTVSNGAEALRALQNAPYDLVLMDCEMPILDGFSATAQLRAWEAAEQRPRTPVIALTAHILSEHKERARSAGMDGHMAKPVELSLLRELIQHWATQKQCGAQVPAGDLQHS